MDLKEKFADLGCSNDQNSTITLYVINDLSKRRGMYLVNYHYSEKLERLYLTAKKTQDSQFNTYLPISSKESLPYSTLNTYVETLSENTLDKAIVLAFCTQDTKCIYYKLEEGLPK